MEQVTQRQLNAEGVTPTHVHTLAPQRRQAHERHAREIRLSLTWKFYVVQTVPFIDICSDIQRLTLRRNSIALQIEKNNAQWSQEFPCLTTANI